MTIDEFADVRGLAVAVVMQAVRDLVNPKAELSKRLDAFLWLVSDEFTVWADWAGMEYVQPYKLLSSDWGKLKTKIRWRTI